MKKNNIIHGVLGAAALLMCVASCSEKEVYSTSVVKEIQLYLNDTPWAVNTGLSTKPLFIYEAGSGEYVANYTSHYRFQLPDGEYKIVASTVPGQIAGEPLPASTNLNEALVRQDPAARAKLDASAPVDYNSPFSEPLVCRSYSRWSVLRLRALDRKSDRSYTTVRAIVNTPVVAYKLADASYVVEGTPLEISLDRATTTGGVNYAEDFVLFPTEANDQQVSVRIDYLNTNGTVVQSKPIDGAFTLLPNDTTEIAFELNNASEPIIQNYTVTLASEGWTDEEINPEPPLRVPEGYTYVSPDDDMDAVFNALKNDPAVTDIKLFLKAGANYTLGNSTMNDCPKGIYILGQTPQDGQQPATLNMGTISLGANTGTPMPISAVHFENLIIKAPDRFFNFRNQDFEVQDIVFRNCELPDVVGTMWYQIADADLMQIIHRFTIDNCRFMNIDLGGSALIGLGSRDLPIHNFIWRNSTFHATTLGTQSLISNLHRMKSGTLSVEIENCTFVNMGGGDMLFLNLDGRNVESFNLVLRNNLITGISTAGQGRWVYPRGVTTRDVSNNWHTADFVLNNWGVEANETPQATADTMEQLFVDPANGDFTIRDTSSEVYINRIGDPHWIR
ncbi:MAG: DUF5123 domain-containing protein [Mediterranea sp.]|jgi:hypothetical protein|nr:DUF5123 domain-containing protein [Mediterranea sp.]